MGLALVKPTKFDVSVLATTTILLAANADREYALFINDSDTVIYLAFGVDAVANSGVRLNISGGSYEMSRGAGNLSQAAVNAIAAAEGGKVCCGIWS